MVVYWDLLFVMNFISDYFILCIVSAVSYKKINYLRFFTSSLIGGLYGIFVFDSNFKIMYNPALKIIFLILTVYIAFGKTSFGEYIKLLLYYSVISFVLSGVITFLNNFFGVFEMTFTINMIYIFASVIISFLLMYHGIRLLNRNAIKNKDKKQIEIFLDDKKVTVVGIMDSGNLLLDPITRFPVMIVTFDAIKDMLPDDLVQFLKEGSDLKLFLDRKYSKIIRLIPYKSVGNNSILKGFKPDKIIIKGKRERVIYNIIIAVTYNNISNDDKFSAILNPQC